MDSDNTNMRELTRGSLLAKNTILNLVFQGVPLLIALITIPILIKGMGNARFGVLSIAWIFMGYFSLFDFGIARVLIKMIGERLAAGKIKEVPPLFWTGFTLMSTLGVVMALVVIGLSRVLVYRVLNIPPELQAESVIAFRAIGLSVPLVISTAAIWGSMEAKQCFLHVNSVRTLNSIFTLVLPVIALMFTHHIGYIVLTLCAGRLLLWFVSFRLLYLVLDVLKSGYVFSRDLIKPILQLGGWMTVSNIVSPLMVYADRFFIGVLLTVSAVTWYVTPYEVVTKMLMISIALNRVLFPAFSASYRMDRQRAERIYHWGRKMLWVLLFPLILIIITFAAEILQIWVGSDFVNNSTLVMQCLAMGVFVNAPAQISFALIQGAGRPSITGKVHLIELPLYLLLFYALVTKWGINGAAVAWALRVAIDAFFMSFFARRLLEFRKQSIYMTGMVSAFLLFFAAVLITGFLFKVLFVLVIAVIYIVFVWRIWLTSEDKAQFIQMVKRKK